MKNIFYKFDLLVSKISIWEVAAVTLSFILAFGSVTQAIAATTSNFTQTITAGTLTADIVDDSYVTVGSPSVTMTSTAFSFSCQTATGTFGSNTQRLYVSNPDGADNGWTLSVAASATTDVWDSAGTDFDFNDPTSSGCTDGADADSLGGQMTVDPSTGTITQGSSANGTTGVSLGSSDAFEEGTTDSVTLMSSDGTIDIGDWYLTGVGISQTIPAEQPAASDYNIDMVISVAAI